MYGSKPISKLQEILMEPRNNYIPVADPLATFGTLEAVAGGKEGPLISVSSYTYSQFLGPVRWGNNNLFPHPWYVPL